MHSNGHQRRIIVCADDYALHPHIDAAVVQLAQAGRLTATSCMTTSPRWTAAAAALQPLRPALAVGLHFNLTESHGGACQAFTLRQVLIRAYLRRISPARARAHWRQQLDAFEAALQTAPDFIDGHQHVHQFPRLREALLAELQSRYEPAEMPWLRSTIPAGRLLWQPKAAVIALLGGWSATRRWRRAGMRCNAGFAGVYGFDAATAAAYGARMRHWLRQLPDGGLLMCHPATGVVPGDALAGQRAVEFSFLRSAQFAEQLRAGNCVLGRRDVPQAVGG